MSRKLLKHIIHKFSREKFLEFFRIKNRAFKPYNEYTPEYDDKDFDKSYFLGEIPYSSTDKLIVYSIKVKKELTERSGKKAQYDKAKKILKGKNAEAGIFIFYDINNNFRFSLIFIDYLGTRRKYSTFKRYTYFVCPELTNKTFLYRIGDGSFSSIEQIKEAFSVEKVTKEFYSEIANWYFWAIRECIFPENAEQEENGRNICVIRLITRMIFIWFMTVRNLIPKNLFDYNYINDLLKDLSHNKTTYYKAILQNLFFATLNTKIKNRKFRFKKTYQGKNKYYMDHTVYRYEDYFRKKEDMLDIFKNIPFLNGGLFNCLDKRINENNKSKEIRFDGFSDKDIKLKIPNILFFSDEKIIDLNKEFGTKNKKYKVEGLINILSSYNFTIDENEPDDQEVALDPELLGKVFENLLASYNPETATTARKSTGSYYTPREIVEYMVAQSLKEYFKSHLKEIENPDDKLDILFSKENTENPFKKAATKKIVKLIDELRIVDPAVGSGAFPMGILNKLVGLLSKLDPDNKLWKETQLNAADTGLTDPLLKKKIKKQIIKQFKEKNFDYGRKLYLIQKCIYGVDIQQIAVEVAKLRFFISLLVDEKIDKSKENWGIEPLPNLDFKLMQGNSLKSEFMGIDLDKEIEYKKDKFFEEDIDRLIKEFQRKKNKFQNEPDRKKKDILLKEINNLIINIFEEKLKKQKKGYFQEIKNIEQKYNMLPNIKQREDIIAKEKAKLYKKTGFNLETVESQLREFTDGQKARPFFSWKIYFSEVFQQKGGFDVVIANPPYIKEYTNKKAFDGLKNSPYYQGKMDIWYLFACCGIDLLKNDSGILTFIAQNNWVTSYGASKLRNKIINDTKIHQLLDFGNYKIFEHAGIQTMILILKRESNTDNYKFDYRKILDIEPDFKDILDLLNETDNSKIEFLSPVIQKEKYLNAPFTFSNSGIEKVLNKIYKKSNFKVNKNEITNGIHPHHDKVNKERHKILGTKYNIGEGIFGLTEHEKKNIAFTKKELELIKPYYTTKELVKYYVNKNNSEWIIYTDSKFKKPKNIIPYPNIKKHLDKFQKVITSDNKPYGLHRARNEKFFNGEKIISVRKCIKPSFTYTDFDCYVSAAFFIIKTQRINLKYLTALLNSKLIIFWLKHKGKMQGNNFQIDKEPLLALPLIKPNEKTQKPLIDIVDKILLITKSKDYLENQEKKKKVKKYELEIDNLVYKLYGLTPEEIEIIEGTKK